MSESAPQLQILLNLAREDHLTRVREHLRIKKLQQIVGVENAPEWDQESAALLIKARKRHKALMRRLTESFATWPHEMGGES